MPSDEHRVRPAAQQAAAALTVAVQATTMRAARGQDIRIRHVRYSPLPPPLGAFLLDTEVADPTGATSERHLLEVPIDRETLDGLADPVTVEAMAFTSIAIAMEWWDLHLTNHPPAGIRKLDT